MSTLLTPTMPEALAWTFLGLGLALALFGRRLVGAAAPGVLEGPPPLPRWGLVYLGAIVLGALALRAWLGASYQLYNTETYSLERACAFRWSAFERTAEGLYHAPLQPLVARAWLGLDEILGAGFEVSTIRVPSLVLAAVAQLLLARLGVLLRAPLGGLAAATLFGFGSFPLRVSLPAENYVFELCGALFFAERCAQYLLWRRPVYASLAVSGAVALWCGYMNVPLLGLGGVALLVTFARRRDYRGALLTLVVAALLVAPILPSLWRAGHSYTTVSVRDATSPEEIAQLERATQHPILPVRGTFSRGRFELGLWRVAEGLYGPFAALLFAGALLALVFRRLRALPLFLLLFALPLLGTRMLLNPQNYAAVVPLLLLLTVWGFDAIPWPARLGRAAPWLRAGVQIALVALGLVGGYEKGPLFSAQPDREFFLFEHIDLAPLRRVAASAPPKTPLLAYDLYNAPVFNFGFCDPKAPACERSRCSGPGDAGGLHEEAGPFELVSRAGREMATPKRQRFGSGDRSALAPALGALFARPAWAQGALVLHGNEPRGGPETLALDAVFDAHCRKLVTEWAYTLYRCEAAAVIALARSAR